MWMGVAQPVGELSDQVDHGGPIGEIVEQDENVIAAAAGELAVSGGVVGAADA